MKLLTLFSALTLTALAACGSLGGSVDVMPTDGAIGRQIERVAARHDHYVRADDHLVEADEALALSQSAALEALANLPAVSRLAVAGAYAPVAARHDSYVRADAALLADERDTYLATSDQLRRLLNPPK